MQVYPTQPFQVIYSLFEHEYLGFLFESFIIQVNSLGKLTLQHQSISSKNAKEFEKGLDETDFELIKLIDHIQQDAVYGKFGDKKQKPIEFFNKLYDKNKGNKELQEHIQDYVGKYMSKILAMLVNKHVFIMGTDGEPTWRPVKAAPEKATVLFHFYRNAENTHYFPTIKYLGEKVDFQYKDARILCTHPAYLLCGEYIYSFEKEVDGNKLKPFLNKKFIEVPKRMEEDFFKKFGSQLVASFDVYAKGLEIKIDKSQPKPVLVFSELQSVSSTPTLFGYQSQDHLVTAEEDEEVRIVFELNFRYGDFSYRSDNQNPTQVKLDKSGEDFVFYKIPRQLDWEKSMISSLKKTGLELMNAKAVRSKAEAFSWITIYREELEKQGFIVQQNPKDSKKYFTGASSIKIDISENIDWFDIRAIIRFGEFEVPFYYLKNLILKKQKEFKLPNGEIAVIPEEWFAQYAELFAFIGQTTENENTQLKKYHVALVQELEENSLAAVTISRKLEKLRDFTDIEDVPLPDGFKGELRPYQKAGYNWMHFLQKYKFGGCLADDMGLGKTVQTLAFIQSQSDDKDTKCASLLIVPTSLIYNWEVEAGKFTPSLKILIYTGTFRNKNIERFGQYDLVITSYGIARLDEEILGKYFFHYLILDESQAIKNPGSNTSKSLKGLSSRFRLILTGTPIENTTMDLWSQMSFINPGLLGSQIFFKDEFLNPIEKKQDDLKAKKLLMITKPFILRRLKSQVAKDLPDKIEAVRYCHMTEAQEKLYEETKSYFRNKILEDIDENGMAGTQMILLQGLTRLRQIANHPLMVDKDYEGKSGKLEDIAYMLQEALSENHKVLIFSQFVKHLSIFRAYLENENIPYAYLDGNTADRREQVETFQNNDGLRVFLISLRAGGTGLNLTAADYVFILDPWWNPAIEAQAIDRAHRIGQNKNVFIYKFITRKTVEEKILLLQQKKKWLAGEIVMADEGFVKSLSKEDIRMILE